MFKWIKRLTGRAEKERIFFDYHMLRLKESFDFWDAKYQDARRRKKKSSHYYKKRVDAYNAIEDYYKLHG